jgi:hypothetical protein
MAITSSSVAMRWILACRGTYGPYPSLHRRLAQAVRRKDVAQETSRAAASYAQAWHTERAPASRVTSNGSPTGPTRRRSTVPFGFVTPEMGGLGPTAGAGQPAVRSADEKDGYPDPGFAELAAPVVAGLTMEDVHPAHWLLG